SVAPENAQIYSGADVGQRTFVGKLPERPVVFDVFDEEIIISNPERIISKIVFQQFIVKMFATINDWLNVVMLFHRVEPLLQSDFKAVHRLIGRVGFYIQHRSQISRFELHISDKILSLQQAVFIGAVKMVSTPNK